MFSPELDKAGVLEVVSEVLCKPGYTSGPSEEKRLLRSIGSGRVDIRTMARLLRWLRGERVAQELRDRGLKFVGPSTEAVLRPITTGLGMTHLTKEVRNNAVFLHLFQIVSALMYSRLGYARIAFVSLAN